MFSKTQRAITQFILEQHNHMSTCMHDDLILTHLNSSKLTTQQVGQPQLSFNITCFKSNTNLLSSKAVV